MEICIETCGMPCIIAFCKPTARCFKGISILTAIYASACLLICAFIGPLIKVHDGTTVDAPEIGTCKDGRCITSPTASEIAVRVHTLTACTLIIAVWMYAISIFALLFFFKY